MGTDILEDSQSSLPERKRSHWPIAILSTASSLVNLFMPLVLVRLLDPQEIGIFKVFFLYLTIVPAFTLVSGFMDGLAYWSGQPGDRRNIALQMSGTFILLAALAFSIVGLTISPWLADIQGWELSATLLFSAALFGHIGGSYYEEVSIANGRIWQGALFFSGFEIFRAICIVVATILYPSVTTIFMVHVIVISCKTAIGFCLCRAYGYLGGKWDSKLFKELWKYAIPVSLAWIFGIFVTKTDQVVLSMYLSNEDFAFYTVGCLAIPPLFVLEHSICRVMIPQLSKAFTEGDFARGALLYYEACENIALFIIPAVVGLFVFADPIIVLLFTKTYANAAHFLGIFAFSYLAIIIPYDAVPRALAKSGWLLKNFIKFSIFSLLITLILVPAFGSYGALIGLLFTYTAMRIYAIWFVQHETGWPISVFVPLVSLLRLSVIAVGLGAICTLVRGLFPSDLAWFLTLTPLFAIAYFGILALWKLTPRRQADLPARVLHILPSCYLGGMERMVLNLTGSLKLHGKYEPIIFAFDHQPGSDDATLIPDFARRGIRVETYYRPQKKRFSIAAVWRLLREVYAYDVEILHSHNLGALIHAVLVKSLLFRRIKLIHTQHSFVHLAEKSRYVWYEKFFTRFADMVTCVSPDTLKQYREFGLKEERLIAIDNGVEFGVNLHDPERRLASRTSLLRELPTIDGSDLQKLKNLQQLKWVLYLARVDHVKGQDLAIDLWKTLPPVISSQCALVLVGPEAEGGALKKMHEQITASGASNVVYVGATKDPQAWYSASDLYLSCSKFEGHPLGPIEGLGAGLPLVLSKIKGHDFLAGRASFLDFADAQLVRQQFAQALERLLQAQNSGNQDNAEWARTEFSVARMRDRYMALYAEALTAFRLDFKTMDSHSKLTSEA